VDLKRCMLAVSLNSIHLLINQRISTHQYIVLGMSDAGTQPPSRVFSATYLVPHRRDRWHTQSEVVYAEEVPQAICMSGGSGMGVDAAGSVCSLCVVPDAVRCDTVVAVAVCR
jgi:hypothetical protein